MRRALPLALFLLLLTAVGACVWLVLRNGDRTMPDGVGGGEPAPRTPAPRHPGPTQPDGAQPASKPASRVRARAPAELGVAPDAERREVTGTVYAVDDDNWEPLPGARVTLLAEDLPAGAPRMTVDELLARSFLRIFPERVIAETTSGAEGEFAFHDVPPEAVVLLAQAEGFGASRAVAENDTEIGLAPPNTARIRVLGPDGGAVGGARVYVAAWQGVPPHQILTTDDDGLAIATISDYAAILVTHDGLSAETRDIEGDATIRLRPERTISGRVVDSSDVGVAGASVISWDTYVEPALTGTDGAFVLRGLGPDGWAHTILTVAEGFVTGLIEAVPGTQGVRIELQRPARVSGRVVDAGGSPAAGAEVRSRGGATTTTAVDGTFTLTLESAAATSLTVVSLEPQDFDLGEFPRPFGQRATAWIEPRAGAEVSGVELRMALIPESYVFVRAVDPRGETLPSYHVSVWADTSLGLPESQGMRRGGWFLRVPVPPGSLVTADAHQSDRDDLEETVEVEVTTVAAPEGAGQVVEFAPIPRDDSPIAAVTLAVLGPDGRALPPGSITQWRVRSTSGKTTEVSPSHEDSASECEFHVVADCDVDVDITAPGWAGRRFRVPAPPEGPSRVELRLDAAATVVGRLTGATPEELVTAQVEVNVSGDGARIAAAWADIEGGLAPDGSFRITDLAAGSARLVVWDQELDRITAERNFDIRAGDAIDLGAIDVRAFPTMLGAFRDGDRPLSGAIVEVRDGVDGRSYTVGSTDQNGELTLGGPVRQGVRVIVTTTGPDGFDNLVSYAFEDVVARPGAALPPPAGGHLRVFLADLPDDRGDANYVETTVRLPNGVRVLADATNLFGEPDLYLEIHELPHSVVDLSCTVHCADGRQYTWRGSADVPRTNEAREVTLQR